MAAETKPEADEQAKGVSDICTGRGNSHMLAWFVGDRGAPCFPGRLSWGLDGLPSRLSAPCRQ